MARRLSQISLLALLALLFSACNNTIVMRTKDRIALAPGTGQHNDSFFFERPGGAVDVLFVLDHTRDNERYLADFREEYTRFLSQMNRRSHLPLPAGIDARESLDLVDYRVQAIATPTNEVPEHYFSKWDSMQAHLAGIFDEDRATFGGTAGIDPILTSRGPFRYFEVHPLNAFQSLLSQNIFEKRGASNLFVVYFGQTDVSMDMERPSLEAFKQLVNARDQKNKVYPWFLYGRTTPTNVEALVASTSWRTMVAEPSDRFADRLVQAIIATQSKMVLSYTPTMPQAMSVYKRDHLFIYGEDYTYNARENSIEFINLKGLEAKDPISVSYHVGTGSPGIPGAIPPGRPMVPGEAK